MVLLLLTSTNKNESYLHYIYERERENERLEAQERKLRSSRKENVFSVRSCGSGLWSLDTFIFFTMENIYIIKYKIKILPRRLKVAIFKDNSLSFRPKSIMK